MQGSGCVCVCLGSEPLLCALPAIQLPRLHGRTGVATLTASLNELLERIVLLLQNLSLLRDGGRGATELVNGGLDLVVMVRQDVALLERGSELLGLAATL